MIYPGKILIAKERVTVIGVKERNGTTLQSTKTVELPSGTALLCLKVNTKGDIVTVIHDEGVWVAKTIHFAIAKPSDILSGKSFCFTGKGQGDRLYYKALVELHEGTYDSGVTKRTSYLVGGPWIGATEASTKLKAAKNFQVPIISYDEFHGMIA